MSKGGFTIKKKIIYVVLATVFSLATSSYVVFVADRLFVRLKKGKAINGNLFSPTGFKLDTTQLQLSLLLGGILLCMFLYIYYYGSVKAYKSDLVTITPAIKIPAPTGQLQHGSARFLTDSEVKAHYKTITLSKDILAGINPQFERGAIPIGYEKRGATEHILTIQGDVHTVCIGATRCGKSRTLVIQSIVLQALAGCDLFNTDPKGELYQYTYPLLKELGYEVLVIDFKNPKKSLRYNFLQTVIDAIANKDIPKAISCAWDIVDSFVKDDGKSDPLWSNGEKATLASAILLVVYDNSVIGLKKRFSELSDEEIQKLYKDKHKNYQNLINVYNFIARSGEIVGKDKATQEEITLLTKVIKALDEDHPASKVMATVEAAPDKTRGSFIASALSTLKLFTDPNISTMTSETHPSFFNMSKKKAIFVILPDEKATYYQLASMLTNQLYQLLVHTADERGGRLEREFKFNLDEFGNFSQIPGFDNKMTVAAGRGIHFNLYLQSYEQLNLKYGNELTNVILGNCHYTVYLKSTDKKTREMLSSMLGKYTCMGVGTSSSDSGKLGMSSNSFSSSSSLVARELLTPDEIGKIARPYMLVIADNGFPAITQSPDLSKWYFNKLLGLGSEKHNTELRKKRESDRTVFPLVPMTLWDYKTWYMPQKINTRSQDEEEVTLSDNVEKTTETQNKPIRSFDDFLKHKQKEEIFF